MKIKPNNFDMNFRELTARTYEGGSHLRYPVRTFTSGEFGERDDMGVFTPFALNAGSRVRIKIDFTARGSISYEATYDRDFRVNGNYDSVKAWFEAEVGDLGSFGSDYTWNGVDDIGPSIDCGFGLAGTNNYISGYGFSDGTCGNTDSAKFYVVADRKGTASRNITTNVKFEILNADGVVIFETEPQDTQTEIFYESSQIFDIVDGEHQGNVQNQDGMTNAIIELDFHNCYVQGNGAESYRYKDALNVGSDSEGNSILANYLNIDSRPTAKLQDKYQEVRRIADLTYSEIFNENTSLNRLNEFNLAKANFKDDIDRSFGSIQYIHSRDTDLVLFQEDKVSKVLYGKDLLNSADGGGSITSVEEVLGQQVPYSGEYGISRNPESFASYGYAMYFVDAKRGAVMRLSRDGMNEISAQGLRTYFRDLLRGAINDEALGCFDPHLDQYVVYLAADDKGCITHDEKVSGWTSRHSFRPQMMVGMNNEFYTFSDGNLYKHHSDNSQRNEYYGVTYPSEITLMQNESPSEVKVVQAVMLEGSEAWDTIITAFLTDQNDTQESTISKSEYVEKEGMWYAYARRNELTHYDSNSSYGIGVIETVNPTTNIIQVDGFSTSLSVGDTILNGNLAVLGTVLDFSVEDGLTTIILSGTLGASSRDFVFGTKDNRIEGADLRGYTIKLDLTSESTERVELFATNIEAKKSFS